MRPVRDLYRDYKIMPSLAAHQFRAAGVAWAIMDAIDERALPSLPHRSEVISACLLHDMGNILKFDLSYFPEFLVPEGSAYWEGVKADFGAKYGVDEHAATLQIAREIGVSALTREYIDAVGFPKAVEATEGDSMEKKICCYADQRVAPRGVVSLGERWKEGSGRYAGRSRRAADEGYAARQTAALAELETQIFEHAAIAPDAITEFLCEKYFPALERFELI